MAWEGTLGGKPWQSVSWLVHGEAAREAPAEADLGSEIERRTQAAESGSGSMTGTPRIVCSGMDLPMRRTLRVGSECFAS